MSGGPQSLVEIVELLCLTWSEMAVMTCVSCSLRGRSGSCSQHSQTEKKLLPKQLHVSSANVKGLEIRPSLAPILL